MTDKYATFKDGILDLRLIKGLHAIPKGAKPLTEAQWFDLTQRTEVIWKLNEKGELESSPIPVPSVDLEANERAWRDAQIDQVKWIRERHRDEVELEGPTTISPAEYSQLLAYVQLLRDWPASADFPSSARRPVAPGWIEQQAQ